MPLKLGVDVLLDDRLELVRGRRVGLITNPTGIDAGLRSTIDRLRTHRDVDLVALFGPEHGVRGDAQAGEYVPSHRDERLGLPVHSLYGPGMEMPPDRLDGIDERMRSFDTQASGKTVDPGTLSGIDVLLYDLQDVGTRVYTYVATMAYALAAAAARGIPFVVLDRPNPLGGTTEGPVLEYPRYSSFIGLYPIPLRHGMTVGELARLFNARFIEPRAELVVVPMDDWCRADWFDDTGLPWVPPSPNLPTLDAAVVYPGQVILEGTNLSEGRGTTKPFELFGAAWIDGHDLARELGTLGLPGVRFREAWFTPTFSKFAGRRCGGCQLHVFDRRAYRPVATTLAILETIRRLHGPTLELHDAYFDHVMGTSAVREALVGGQPWRRIVAGWEAGLADFASLAAAVRLYD